MLKNPDQYEEIVLTTRQLNLHGLVWGEGQVTLALHGWMDNAMTFSGIAPLLESTHCIALDLPGHGRSDHRPAGSVYHFVDYIADICSVIAKLREQHGVRQINLMGHSLGAAIASMVAGVIPDEINRLVLIEGLGPRTCEADEAVVRHRDAIEYQRATRRKRSRTIGDISTAIKARHVVGELLPSSARCLVERNLEQVEDGWRWRSDPRLRDKSAVYLTEAVVRAHLEAITAKSLVIRALDADDASRRWILERLPCLTDVQLVELAGAHHLHLDTPEPVADAINAFLRTQQC